MKSSAQSKPVHVLVIEDDKAYAQMIQEFLLGQRGSSFLVDCVHRLSDGLKRLGSGDVDVVVLDLHLPDGQGLEVFERVYACVPGVPIIILSGSFGDQTFAVEAVEKGAQDYLVKASFEWNTFLRSLHYAIRRKATEEALKTANGQLKEKLREVDRLNQIMMEREERILELKEEVKILKAQSPDRPKSKA